VAKALAHPSRLMILESLEERERCVCELTALVGADQSTVSKHLAVLKQAGLVADRKEGSKTFYRPNLRCLKGVWECIETVLKQNLVAQQAALGQ
jgi:ArsR family transcriptional regulator